MLRFVTYLCLLLNSLRQKKTSKICCVVLKFEFKWNVEDEILTIQLPVSQDIDETFNDF